MLNILKKHVIKESVTFAPWFPHPAPGTPEQQFRQKTADDIRHLEGVGRKDLAKLEAQKLIIHLTKEFEL